MPFHQSLSGQKSNRLLTNEVKCLADNIYHEARGESFKGKLAVAIVTINRKNSGNYPSTICRVVYQKYQFTWTNRPKKVTDYYQYVDALTAANMALENERILGEFKATHYHNTTVSPKWGLKRVAKIGKHIFYS